MTQLLCHLWGDYIFQSDWMAHNKTKASWPCLIHVVLYSAGFFILRPSWKAVAVIAVTHFLIDRFRLARYVVWAKNWMGPWYQSVEVAFNRPAYVERQWRRKNPTPDFVECVSTGYPPTNPIWLSTWLLIIADNILHLTINYFTLKTL